MPTPREVFFEPDEYARRVAAVQAAMAEQGLDLLVTPSPGNICYLNGYVSMNVLDIMFLCLPVEGEAVFYLWQFERGRAESTVTGSETVCWDTGVEPISFVAEDLSRRGLGQGRVGMDIGSIHTSFEVVRGMLDALGAEPCRGIVETVRLVKSPRELDYIREAAAVTDAGARAALEAVAEGASDWDIAAAAQGRTRAGELGVLLARAHHLRRVARGRTPQPAGRHPGGEGRLGVRRALRREGPLPRPAHENHLHGCAVARRSRTRGLLERGLRSPARDDSARHPRFRRRRRGGQGAGADSRPDSVPRPLRLPGRHRLSAQLDREPVLLPLRSQPRTR